MKLMGHGVLQGRLLLLLHGACLQGKQRIAAYLTWLISLALMPDPHSLMVSLSKANSGMPYTDVQAGARPGTVAGWHEAIQSNG